MGEWEKEGVIQRYKLCYECRESVIKGRRNRNPKRGARDGWKAATKGIAGGEEVDESNERVGWAWRVEIGAELNEHRKGRNEAKQITKIEAEGWRPQPRRARKVR